MDYHHDSMATMAPDVYAGPECDGVEPRWMVSHEKDGPEPQDVIELNPKHFPAGTRIVIQTPICPNCGVPADFSHNHGTGETDNCACGFNWREWALDEFS